MPRKLELTTSRQIVHTALGTFRPIERLDLKGTLGDFIPNATHRDQFRETVRKLVREKNFDIHPAAIPILPRRTIEDIVQALTISALPGNVYTPIIHSKPPSPPSPKRKTPPPSEPHRDFELPGTPSIPKPHKQPPKPPTPKLKAKQIKTDVESR